jgi:hypothetical protein
MLAAPRSYLRDIGGADVLEVCFHNPHLAAARQGRPLDSRGLRAGLSAALEDRMDGGAPC